jgi:hypothetical protein
VPAQLGDARPWTYAEGPTSQPTKVDRDLLDEANARTGAAVIGRWVFDVSEGWGDIPPFSGSCFVLTHRQQERLVKGQPRSRSSPTASTAPSTKQEQQRATRTSW